MTTRHYVLSLSLPTAAALVALLATLVLAAPVSANTMYNYTGGFFQFTAGAYTTEDRISGYFVLADSFVPAERTNDSTWVTPGVLEYQFTDGHQTLTQANSTAVFAVPLGLDLERQVPTGRSGFGWYFRLSSPTGAMASGVSGSDGEDDAVLAVDWAEFCIGAPGCQGNYDGPGVWTVTQTVPEPGTLILLSLGLGGALGLRALRRGAAVIHGLSERR